MKTFLKEESLTNVEVARSLLEKWVLHLLLDLSLSTNVRRDSGDFLLDDLLARLEYHIWIYDFFNQLLNSKFEIEIKLKT